MLSAYPACRVQSVRARNCREEGKNISLTEELQAAVAARHVSCQAGVERGKEAEPAASSSCQVRQEHRDSKLPGRRVSFV